MIEIWLLLTLFVYSFINTLNLGLSDFFLSLYIYIKFNRILVCLPREGWVVRVIEACI